RPEVDDRHSFRELVAEQGAGRLREQDLAPVPGGADPRRADDVEPEVALLTHGRLSCVEAHAHAHLGPVGPGMGGEGALSVNGARNGLLRASEGVEEGISLRVDLGPAVLAQVLAQEQPVVANYLLVAIAELLEELR